MIKPSKKLTRRPQMLSRRESFDSRSFENFSPEPVTTSKKTSSKSGSAAKIGLYEDLSKSRNKAFLLLTTHKNDTNLLAYYQRVLKHIEAAQDLLSLKLLTPSELKELSAKK